MNKSKISLWGVIKPIFLLGAVTSFIIVITSHAALESGKNKGGQAVEETSTGLILPARVIADEEGRELEFDNKFKVPVFATIEHHEIHEGDSYEIHIDSANAAVASLNLAFRTLPGEKLVHLLCGWSSSDEILFEIVEGAGWTQGTGTATTFYNLERNSSNTSTTILENKNQATFTASNQVIKNVTGVAGGTVLDKQYTYNASVGQNRTAETRNATHERILKSNTNYLIRMTQTDGNCKMSISFFFYEHTNE
jgi:hypothetical protein